MADNVYLWQALVDGRAAVVERWSLQDDATRARHTCHEEHPQEEAVQHHGHVFPVLHHLYTPTLVSVPTSTQV